MTALKVPNTTRMTASRAPSNAAYTMLERFTVANTTSAVRRSIVASPNRRNTRKEREAGPSIRCAAYTNHATATSTARYQGFVVVNATRPAQVAHTIHAPGCMGYAGPATAQDDAGRAEDEHGRDGRRRPGRARTTGRRRRSRAVRQHHRRRAGGRWATRMEPRWGSPPVAVVLVRLRVAGGGRGRDRR